MRQTLNKKELSFEIITKLMVLRANGAVLRMSWAPFVILLSPVVTSRAFARIFGRAVLGQKKANIGACVPIRKENDKKVYTIQNRAESSKQGNDGQRRTALYLAKKANCFGLTSPAKRLLTGEKLKMWSPR
jgi:hypothetical protein